jgi:hypothetical protein
MVASKVWLRCEVMVLASKCCNRRLHSTTLELYLQCTWNFTSFFLFVIMFCICADHNRQHQADGVFKSGGEAPPSVKPGEVSIPSQQPPSAPQPQPTPVDILLLQLRHSSAGFEALGVLVQYLVYNVSFIHLSALSSEQSSSNTMWTCRYIPAF